MERYRHRAAMSPPVKRAERIAGGVRTHNFPRCAAVARRGRRSPSPAVAARLLRRVDAPSLPIRVHSRSFAVKIMPPLLFRSTNGQAPPVNLRDAFLIGQAP